MITIPDVDETSLDFEIRRLGVTKLRGTFNDYTVTIRRDSSSQVGWAFDLQIATASLATEDSSHDARLTGHSLLQAERYPEIVFRTRRAVPLHDLTNSLSRVSGDLTIKGVTRQVDWDVELIARAEDIIRELGADYIGRLECEPWKWGIGSSIPILRQTVTITLRLLVIAADRGEDCQRAVEGR